MAETSSESETNPKLLNAAVVGKDGTFCAASDAYTLPSDIRELFARLEGEPMRKLTLYIHGGLTSVPQGLDTARKILDNFRGISHPITVVWGTGVSETIDHDLGTISSTELFQTLLELAVKKVLERFGLAAGARGDVSQDDVRVILGDNDRLDRYEAQVRVGASALDLDDQTEWEDSLAAELTPEVEDDPRLENARAGIGLPPDVEFDADTRGVGISLAIAYRLARATYRLGVRYARSRDHGLRETVFEEITRAFYLANLATWAWDGMKSRSEQMWLPDVGTRPELERHVGSALLDGLDKLNGDARGVTVDVIGHSAGAIALCHLLAAVPRCKGVKIRNVVFLAPACTVDLFYDEVVSQTGRFDQLRMFALRDVDECRDAILPGYYNKSLLYLVSGALEREADELILGLERHTVGRKPYDTPKAKAVHEFLSEPGRTILAGDEPVNGLSCNATTHGGFIDDDATIESLKVIVSS